MIILPAIDIKNGECVRLYKGEMDTAQKVADDYMETAKAFKSANAEWIHMVDLDGAINGKRVNSEIFIDVAKNSGLKVQLGGGIRKIEDIEYYINNGISRVVLGSAAIKNPELVKVAVEKFGKKIAVGIDAKGNKAAADGWVKVSSIDYIELAKKMESFGVKYIIYTDINRDGMLSGPNFENLEIINEAVDCNIIASGGIANIDDIIDLNKLDLYGTICGRSIYSGSLNLAEAIKESNHIY
ncbi:MAG TPA: 1-(5-phosphoribosyl)-5-[(5-phosphoribosylamino)methylideneamino]imidazole-4-carboxamide isomerase [Clostridia bacterium]|nr:1-(5-phosphoribosyl)-5-[(5-phosphoribosylamino)methylideneamino]imidazole-4-carboxamide isomerase [Clostridia bacterium]